MREIVIISGKGGTGKTSLTASFALLAKNAVLADCDVDAADLHLILTPEIKEKHEFWSGHEAFVLQDKCTGCGACLILCRFGAIKETPVSLANILTLSIRLPAKAVALVCVFAPRRLSI